MRQWWVLIVFCLAIVVTLYVRVRMPLMEIRGTGQTMLITQTMIEDVSLNALSDPLLVNVRLRDVLAVTFGNLTTASEGNMINILVCGQVVQQPTIVMPLYLSSFSLSFEHKAKAAQVFAQLKTGNCNPKEWAYDG